MKAIIVILTNIILVANVYGQNSFNAKTWTLSNINKQKKSNFLSYEEEVEFEKTLIVSGGVSVSSFVNTKNNPGFGFSLGMKYSFYKWRSFALVGAMYYSKIQNKVLKLGGEFYSDEGTILRINQELDFSASFIRIPFLIDYNLYSRNNLSLSISAGPGFSIALTDFSKVVKSEITDEIIGYFDPNNRPISPGGDLDRSFSRENSGYDFNIIGNLVIDNYYAGLMYSIKFTKIKNINYLNSFTFLLGITL